MREQRIWSSNFDDLPINLKLKMASGDVWHMEKRSSVRNDSFGDKADTESSLESGSLSIIVLGASGDLAKKKTFPALFNLYRQGFLPPSEVHIFGYARSKMTDDELKDRIHGYLVPSKNATPEMSEDVSNFLRLIQCEWLV